MERGGICIKNQHCLAVEFGPSWEGMKFLVGKEDAPVTAPLTAILSLRPAPS